MTLLQTMEAISTVMSSPVTLHYADMTEANNTIMDRLSGSELPVLLVIPFVVRDERGAGGALTTTTELNLFFLTKDPDQISIDYKARDIEDKIVQPMRALAREFLYRLDASDIVRAAAGDGITAMTYQPVYSTTDANLYGVFVRATVTFMEGITGCVI